MNVEFFEFIVDVDGDENNEENEEEKIIKKREEKIGKIYTKGGLKV